MTFTNWGNSWFVCLLMPRPRAHRFPVVDQGQESRLTKRVNRSTVTACSFKQEMACVKSLISSHRWGCPSAPEEK